MNAESPQRTEPAADAREARRQCVRRELIVAATCLGWALCFVGAMQLIKSGRVEGPVAWIAAAIPALASVWMFAAYVRYLRRIDELERHIQLQALAWAAGGWFIAISSYLLFEPLGAPSVDTSTMVALMPILFALGILAGRWRYR